MQLDCRMLTKAGGKQDLIVTSFIYVYILYDKIYRG